MPKLLTIDDVFDACRAGTLDASVLASFPHVAGMRERDNRYRSLLDVAIEYKRIDIVRRLLLQYPSTLRDIHMCLALKLAARAGDLAIFKLVVKKAESSSPDRSLSGELEAASEAGCIDIVRYLLSTRPQLDPNEALLPACKGGHLELVRELLKRGANAHLSPDGLFLAQALGAAGHRRRMPNGRHASPPESGVLGLLLAAGITVDAENIQLWRGTGTYGNTQFINHLFTLGWDADKFHHLLLGACDGGHVELVQSLLANADANRYAIPYTELGISQTYWDLDRGVLDAILTRYLREFSLESKKKGRPFTQKEFIVRAVTHGCAGAVSQALSLYPRLASAKREVYTSHTYKSGPLMAHAGDAATVQALLDHGVAVRPGGSISVFSGACEKLDPAAVQLLLRARARLGTDSKEKTPLYYAIHAYCREEQVPDKISIINLLIDAGAETDGDYDESNVLDICIGAPCSAHPAAVVAALLERDPGLLEDRPSDRHPILMRAVQGRECNLSVIKALIGAGASVNVDTSGNKIPLVYNLASNRLMKAGDKLPLLRVLLEAGAEPRAPAYDDRTSLMTFPSILNEWNHWYDDGDDAAALFISDMLDYIKAHGIEGEAGESVGDEADADTGVDTGIEADIAPLAAAARKASRARTEDKDIKADEDFDDEKEPLRKRMRANI
jgi:ankyrin repeat protein